MKFTILADLATWTTDRLMLSLRRQFAYSVGILILLIIPLFCMFITGEPGAPQEGERGIAAFSVLELFVWFTFIRRWRELRRRQKRMETHSNKPSEATR